MVKEAAAALEALGIPYIQDAKGLALNLLTRGRQVPVRIHVAGDRITLYTPLGALDDAVRAAIYCNETNRTLGDGCLVAKENGCIFLKQTAYLHDALLARECMERALGRQRALLETLRIPGKAVQ